MGRNFGKGDSAIPLPFECSLGGYRRVSGCRVVVPHSQQDLDIGGAASVGGFVWLQAVGAADRRVVARVPCSAVRYRAQMILGGVGLCTHSAGVVAGSTALCRVPKGMVFVALGGGAEGDVFGNRAFAVKHGKAGGTERLLRHLTYKGDDHGEDLFTLAVFRAGEPTRCLAHSEGRVG